MSYYAETQRQDKPVNVKKKTGKTDKVEKVAKKKSDNKPTADSWYAEFRERALVPKGLQRFPARLVPVLKAAVATALKKGKDPEKALQRLMAEKGYTLEAKSKKDKAAMKKEKPSTSVKQSKKPEKTSDKAVMKSGKTKNKKAKIAAKAKSKSKSSSDDGDGPAAPPEHVVDVVSAFDVMKMDDKSLKSLLRDFKEAGVNNVTDSKGVVYKLSYNSSDTTEALRKRCRIALKVLHTDELLSTLDRMDTTKIAALGSECHGLLYEASDPNCSACPDVRTCRPQFLKNVKSGFKGLDVFESEKKTAAKTQTPAETTKEIAEVKFLTDVNPYKKEKDFAPMIRLLLRKKPQTVSRLRKLVERFYQFQDVSSFKTFMQQFKLLLTITKTTKTETK